MIHCGLILVFDGAKHRHELAAVVGEFGSTAARAADIALDDRKVRQVVEIVERIPRCLVGHRNALGSLRNRSELLDRLQQANARAAEESTGPRLHLEMSLQPALYHWEALFTRLYR